MNHDAIARILLAALLVGGVAGCGRQRDRIDGDLFYTIETRGVQAGYAVIDTSLVVVDGEPLIQMDQRMHVETRLLGSDIDSESRLTFLLDPASKRIRHYDHTASAGSQTSQWSIDVHDGQAHVSSSLMGQDRVIDLPDSVIVENTLFYENLVTDFADSSVSQTTYSILDIPDMTIREVHYRRLRPESLEHAGRRMDVLAVERTVPETGTQMRMWLDPRTTMLVKLLEKDATIALADPSAVADVRRADMDAEILDETNVGIADIKGITWMKVRARMRPIGLQPTVESLNVPGQRFTGTVDNNVIDGIFEIAYECYDGVGAPPFPLEDPPDTLRESLSADGIFEAEDAVLVAQAREITAGAQDAWEAATRLARWVSDEIAYAVPGGGTARRTYDMRAGECGAHSVLLATFCRAVGIPARMVWGCMYIPDKGGSFGQHGWTEVHMGDAGWIPVDATAGEVDFVDSGHIRVGHFASLVSRLNAEEFEILDYRVAGGGEEATRLAQDRFTIYLGSYRNRQSSNRCEVRVMDGSLVIDIPGATMLALDEPDERGRWLCKVAPHVHVVFDRGDEGVGDVRGFTIHEQFTLPHRSHPEEIDAAVPAELAPCLGTYHLAAIGADFEVSWRRGRLWLRHPRNQRQFELQAGEESGSWTTRNGPYGITFVWGTRNEVASMTLDAMNAFRKN